MFPRRKPPPVEPMPSESVPRVHTESVTRSIEPRGEHPASPLELVAEPDLPVATGDVVGGRYVVDGILAEGGMGVVYLATHSELQQRVAIKFLRENYTQNEVLVQRFLNEARAAASLKSEHIVRVIDVGQLENGRPYLVMEHLEGTDLEALLVREGPFEPERAVRYALEVTSALEEAHGAGIIHRDIKPENLFLATTDGGRQKVKVVDFGLAKRMDVAPLVVTGPQDSMGSPCYMSPEQITTPHAVDARTDVWSLGAVLYRMLTLTMPFDGSTVLEVYARVLNAQPKPLREVRPELDRDIEAIVARCLEKDPARRYQSVHELSAALSAYLLPSLRASDVPLVATEVATPELTRERRGGGSGLLALATIALVAGFSGAWTMRGGHTRTEARALLRNAIHWAIPRTGGDLSTALENADMWLTPERLPDDPKLEGLGDRYRPVSAPAGGVVARRPVLVRGQPTLLAEREHEASALPPPFFTPVQAPSDAEDTEDEAQKQQEYRQFLETQRNIAAQVERVQSERGEEPSRAAPAAAPAPPKPLQSKPSIDDLKAP